MMILSAEYAARPTSILFENGSAIGGAIASAATAAAKANPSQAFPGVMVVEPSSDLGRPVRSIGRV